MKTSTIIKRRRIVGLKDLRTNMEKYIKAVDGGMSFTVVRRSKPIFRIEPTHDEFGEPLEDWETFDFRDKNGNGISTKEFLKLMRKHGSDK
ncbi:MAG: hypothetical protein Q8P93_03115 [bacterium]|nr:hypothetical protein [bacterium]